MLISKVYLFNFTGLCIDVPVFFTALYVCNVVCVRVCVHLSGPIYLPILIVFLFYSTVLYFWLVLSLLYTNTLLLYD